MRSSDLPQDGHTNGRLPLTGLRVADFSVTLPGPYCSQILRRLGAHVVHLEPPGGDYLRQSPPTFRLLSEGKESVVVDLKKEADRDLAREIAVAADVVIEGWRPGVADRLGVGYHEISAVKPSVVYCSISGYGQEGELASRPGHDINYAAEVGAYDLLRGAALPVADLSGAMLAATRIAAAIADARVSRRGAYIDASLAGALRDWVELMSAEDGPRDFTHFFDLPHYGYFATADGGHLVLGVAGEQRLWDELIRVLGRQEWAGMSRDERMLRDAEIREYLAATIAQRTVTEWSEDLCGVDTCWAVVRAPSDPVRITGRLHRKPGKPPDLDEHRPLYQQHRR